MKREWFRCGPRAFVLIALLLLVLVTWALFHAQINHGLALRLFLTTQSPREESFQDLAQDSSDPAEFLRRCWATGRIPHRLLVASFLKANAMANPAWFAGAEPLALAGTLDADLSVRELALATLRMRHDPRLFDLAQAQLPDLDPLVRQLGLDYLHEADSQRGVPAVIPLLDDPDLRVVTRAEAALMRWTGQDFGVRVRMAIHSRDAAQPDPLERADEDKIREGVARRKQWWNEHAKEFPNLQSGAGLVASTPLLPPVADFALNDLAGNPVRLTDFRGKVVLLNFWATWCTACLSEIPDLVALQKKLGDRAAIIGVSLDGLPDEHHHESAEGQGDEHSTGKSLAEIRTKVGRALKARGINYAVLLDPTGSVGGRFNGGELPTTVIIDSSGRVRRRFIGERNLAVFEAMIAEAAK